MATSCRYEFQAKHFGFADVSSDLFQHLQWTKNRWIFLAYRAFMATYVLAWFIYAYAVTTSTGLWQRISNWSEGVMVIYFVVALLVAVHSAVIRNNPASENGKLKWYYIINWILFNVAAVSAFEISVFYWALLAPPRTLERNLYPVTFHIHAINSVLLLIDIFMVAFPCRFLHFVYPLSYGVLYGVFVVILHLTNVNNAVYSVINLRDSPGIAAAYLILAAVIMPVVFHSTVFGWYHLRAFIARKTVLKNQVPSDGAATTRQDAVELGNINPAFQDLPQ